MAEIATSAGGRRTATESSPWRNKDARPRLLNRLKPLFQPSVPPFEAARGHLLAGGSVGIFPEGTVNRDGTRLIRGRRGAARLSLETGVPVVPVGIRFDWRDVATGAADSASPMSLHFGEALRPPAVDPRAVSRPTLTAWHGELMSAIANLCGKARSGGGDPASLGHASIQPPSLAPFRPSQPGDAPC